MRRAILHIGTHKTGTTSIQRFLHDHLGEPAFPRWTDLGIHHSSLASAVARPGRLESQLTRRYARAIAGAPARVRGDLLRAEDLIVYSGENLSLLRYGDEVEQVVGWFDEFELEVVMYTRRPEDFLRSYLLTIRLLGDEPSADPESIFHVEPDSWLVDYRARLDLWGRYAPVTRIDYDEVVARDGSVIPSFAALIGLEPVEYRLNSSDELLTELRRSMANGT